MLVSEGLATTNVRRRVSALGAVYLGVARMTRAKQGIYEMSLGLCYTRILSGNVLNDQLGWR